MQWLSNSIIIVRGVSHIIRTARRRMISVSITVGPRAVSPIRCLIIVEIPLSSPISVTAFRTAMLITLLSVIVTDPVSDLLTLAECPIRFGSSAVTIIRTCGASTGVVGHFGTVGHGAGGGICSLITQPELHLHLTRRVQRAGVVR